LSYRPPEKFEQQSTQGHKAKSLGSAVEFNVNDGNGENAARISSELSEKGDLNAVPFPRPQALPGRCKDVDLKSETVAKVL
jgi:hypothetical protein